MQYIKSRNWKMKEGKYTKSVAKFQGGAIFHMRDIYSENMTEMTCGFLTQLVFCKKKKKKEKKLCGLLVLK